jgi:hypothetical protein
MSRSQTRNLTRDSKTSKDVTALLRVSLVNGKQRAQLGKIKAELTPDGQRGLYMDEVISVAQSSIRVAAMTGYPTKPNIQNILESGAEACLKKSSDKAELMVMSQENWFAKTERFNAGLSR